MRRSDITEKLTSTLEHLERKEKEMFNYDSELVRKFCPLNCSFFHRRTVSASACSKRRSLLRRITVKKAARYRLTPASRVSEPIPLYFPRAVNLGK